MNAFTQKPDTSWVRKLQRAKDSGKAAANRGEQPTDMQRLYLSHAHPKTRFGLQKK